MVVNVERNLRFRSQVNQPLVQVFIAWLRLVIMFWSAPKKKKDDDKERQIKELKQVFPSIRRPNNDDNLFEIKFVVNNQYSSLRVFIPSDFPNTRPG